MLNRIPVIPDISRRRERGDDFHQSCVRKPTKTEIWGESDCTMPVDNPGFTDGWLREARKMLGQV